MTREEASLKSNTELEEILKYAKSVVHNQNLTPQQVYQYDTEIYCAENELKERARKRRGKIDGP